MNQTPSGDGACCLPQADGLMYLKVGARGTVVGMMNLDAVFQQLYALGRGPDEATDAELVSLARRFNYIPIALPPRPTMPLHSAGLMPPFMPARRRGANVRHNHEEL